MSTTYWRGDAIAVAQVDSFTPGGTIEVGDIFIITINGKSVSYSAVGTTVASVCTGMTAVLNASTIQEFEEITWADGTTTITGTADTAGKPFTATATTTESNGGAADAQTFVRAAVTANSGPNDIAVAANWSGGAVPTNEDVVIEATSSSLLYNLSAQSGETWASLTVKQNFTGTIGLPRMNVDGGSGNDSYLEYRATYLTVGITAATIGSGPGAGSGRIKINTGSVAGTLVVLNTGAPLENGIPALLWKGTSASNVVEVNKGSVGIAFFEGAGETANVSGGFRVSYTNQQLSDVDVVCGSGVTIGTLTKSGGKLQTASNITTANLMVGQGEWTHLAGTLGTLTMDGQTLYYQSSGTITAANIGGASVLDFSRDPTSRTVTALNIKSAGVTVLDPNETCTWTAIAAFPAGVGIEDCTLRFGKGKTITVA